MVCGTFTITKISNSQEADAVRAAFNANSPPPTSTQKTQAADGSWTVTANFPPCPANTVHSQSGTLMLKGFDTTEDCRAKADLIKAAGYDFVARYLSRASWKTITSDEAKVLSTAGIAIVLVYEDGPTAPDYFSNARGLVDSARAAQQASALGAPDDTTIYFAVDYDASNDDLAGVINQYFQGANSGMHSFASAGNRRYRVGVYGSGATCTAITTAGLASQGWLAQATGWRGHGAYTSWAIAQGMPANACGLSVDPNAASSNCGAIAAGSILVPTNV